MSAAGPCRCPQLSGVDVHRDAPVDQLDQAGGGDVPVQSVRSPGATTTDKSNSDKTVEGIVWEGSSIDHSCPWTGWSPLAPRRQWARCSSGYLQPL